MRLLFLLFVFSFGSLLAQDIKHFESPISAALHAYRISLLDVSQVDDQLRVVTLSNFNATSSQKVLGFSARTGSDESYPVSVIDVAYHNIASGEIEEKKRHILHSPNFKGAKYRVDIKGVTIGEEDIVVKYDELLQMYPDVSFGYIDKYNYDMTESYYYAKLKNNFGQRITGFTSSKYSKIEKETDQPKKKGLLRKIQASNAANAGIQLYDQETIADYDWSDSYNGKSDKKDNWANIDDFYCPQTGQVVAFTGHRDKNNKDLANTKYQIVNFGVNGELIKKHEVNFEVPRGWIATEPIYNEKRTKLEGAVGFAVDLREKKKNPSFNLKVLTTYYYDIADLSVTQHEVELPFEYSEPDTVFNLEQGVVAIGFKDGRVYGDTYAVVIVSKEMSRTFVLNDEQNEAKYKLTSVLYDKGEGHFAFIDMNANSKTSQGEVLLIANNESGQKLSYSFEDKGDIDFSNAELIQTESNTYLMIKEAIKGQVGELTRIKMARVEKDGLVNIVDGSKFIALESSLAIGYKHNLLEENGKLYWLSRINAKSGYEARLLELQP